MATTKPILKLHESRAVRHTALGEAIRWHEGRVKFYRKERERLRAWSRKHNDGDPDCSGTYAEDDCPLFIKAHLASIRAMRELQLNPYI